MAFRSCYKQWRRPLRTCVAQICLYSKSSAIKCVSHWGCKGIEAMFPISNATESLSQDASISTWFSMSGRHHSNSTSWTFLGFQSKILHRLQFARTCLSTKTSAEIWCSPSEQHEFLSRPWQFCFHNHPQSSAAHLTMPSTGRALRLCTKNVPGEPGLDLPIYF